MSPKLGTVVESIDYNGEKLYLRNIIWEQTKRAQKIGITPPGIEDVRSVFISALKIGTCHYCGCQLVLDHKMFSPSLDHKTPLSKGGKNEISNYAVSCIRCNRLKRSMDYELVMSIMQDMSDYMRYADSEILSNRFKNRFNELRIERSTKA